MKMQYYRDDWFVAFLQPVKRGDDNRTVEVTEEFTARHAVAYEAFVAVTAELEKLIEQQK